MKRISVRNHNAAHVYYGLARRIQAMLFVLVMLVSSVGLPAIAEDDALQPNIYGMVQTRKLEEKQLTASLNGNSEITVTYGQAAQIPDGAQLVVTPVDDEAPYVQQAKKDLNVESVDFVQLFDMGIYYDGAKIEPANKVKISFRLTEDMKRDGDLRIIHFAKDPEPVPAAAPKKLMSVKGAKAAPMATQAQTDEDDLMSVQAAVIDTSITEELNLVFNEENMVSFETYGFSVFGICYTVDFEYNDPETGETYSWSFPGTGSYAIADIMAELGVTGNIESVSLKRTVDVGGAENALYLSDDNTQLVSDVAFQDTFLLTVTVLETVTDENGEETQVEKVYAIQVKDEIKDTLTTTIKFFAKDAEIIKADPNVEGSYMHIVGNAEAPNDPALASTYYVLAILKDSLEHETGWAIQSIGTPTTDTTTVSFNEFNLFETQNEGEAAADYKARRGQVTTGEKVGYDKLSNTIETRLYRADTALATVNYYELVTKADTNKTYSTPEEGYEFGGNFTSADGAQNEIDLKKANNKKYKVRIYLDANAADDITSADHYYLYLKVNHQSNDISYQYVPLTFTASEKKGSYVEYEFPHWMDENGTVKAATASNNTFTGNESSIEVKLLKFDGDFKPNNYGNATVNEEGSAIKAYKVHYDTAATNPKATTTHYYEETETVDGKTIINCIDYVQLQTIDAEGRYNYASILGPNLNYGIVADHLFHDNHLQTNFAVNHYTGHGHDARPDLSGSSGGQIIIAEYNKMVSDFWTNGPTNGIGEPAYDIPNGQLKIGNPLSGTLVVYADIDSGSTEPVDSQNNGKVGGNLAQTVVIQTEGEELSANIVEPALHYMDNMSAELASHPATFVPPIPSSGKLTIDTKAFPDDATIFIDADPIISFIGSAGDLIIEKKPDQTIIFNFKKTYSKAHPAINLAQFVVKQEGFPAAGYETHSPVGTGDPENVYMDAIARHIVWNLYGVQGETDITTSGGIFLQPNEDSEIIIKGTTAGWIVSEGVVSHPSGEWHNVFAEMPETSSVKLNAYKTVDGKQPRASQKFNFFLHEYDTSVDGNWKPIYTSILNKMGSIDFPEIKNLTTGWHVYRITEDQVKPNGTNGLYVMDGDTYYAVVNVKSMQTGNGTLATIVSTPVYYRNFNPADFNASSDTLTGFSNEDKINRVTFDNVEVKEGLNILKKVQGTTATDVEFTFKLELWFEENGTESPIRTDAEINGGQATFTTSTSAGPGTFTIVANENNHSVGYIKLKAGELINITNQFNKAAHYLITETMVGDQLINTETYVQGYKGMTAPQGGSLETDGFARVVFENEYKAEGDLNLKAHKKLTDNTGHNKTLNANSFAFRLGGLHADPDAWVWNDAEGNATLPTIHFTSADMDGAVPDPNNGNKLTKTLNYTVHEKHELGTGASNLTAENLTYDSDKRIIVTLVDNGDGTITATPDVTKFTVDFNNTYEYQATKCFDGTKVLTGRDMDAVEFWFNAELTKYHNGTTETIYANDTQREAAASFVSPTKLSGTNRADGILVFPAITFKQAGTYTFTVTEDENRLPEDVEPATLGQSYEVTIAVTEGTASNGDTILVAAEPNYTNNKTINNTRKKMSFTVTKDWKNMDDEDINNGHSITFTVYKDGEAYSVTSEHIEQVTGTPGSFSVNGNGTVTLTVGTDGWPTVNIKGLDYPASGYTVEETKPEASSEYADLTVKYSLNSGADRDACPAINHNEDALVIKNKEKDNRTNLKVTKQFVMPDGSDGNSLATKDPIYFAVKLHHINEGWTSYYDNGSAINVGSVKGYQITWDSVNNTWSTVDVGEIPATDSNNNPVVKYEIVELAADGSVKTTDASLLAIKYYTNYGKPSQAEVTPINQGQGATITIENKIPEPRHLTVTKKWVDENDAELTDLTGKNTIKFILVHKNAYGVLTYAQEDGSGNITFVSDRNSATEFTLTGSIVNGKQVWTTKRFDDLQLTPDASDAGNYSRYYLVETVGNGPKVTCVLDDGTTVDETHPYDPLTSGTITIVNKEVDNSIKVKKVWIGDDPPASIDVVLKRKYIEHTDWGSTEVERVVLKAANNWSYAWENLPESDGNGTYVFEVIEYECGTNNPVPGYNVEYSSNNGTLKAGDTVTITNTKQTTGIAVHKVWDVENDNDIQPVTVQLKEASCNVATGALVVNIFDRYTSTTDYELRETLHVKSGTNIIIQGSLIQGKTEIEPSTVGVISGDAQEILTISNVTQNIDIKVTNKWSQGQPYTVDYTPDLVIDKSTITEKDKVTLNSENNWYHEWTTDLNPDKYYFVEETTAGYAPTYTNNNGIKTGTITVTNKASEPGALAITKVLKLNGADVTDANKSNAHGDYYFSIVGQGINKVLRIEVENGVAKSAYWGSTHYTGTDYSGYLTDTYSDSIVVSEDKWVYIENLIPGQYTVTELEPTDGSEFVSITPGTNDGGTYDVNTENRSVTFTVVAGDGGAYKAYATFTNNLNTGVISLKKITEAHTNYPVDGNQAYTNGTYPFTIVGPTGSSAKTYHVVITMANGVMTGATFAEGSNTLAAITDSTAPATFDAANGVTLIGLPMGEYTVTEGDWTLTNQPEKTGMYLTKIEVTGGGSSTIDKPNKQATVTLAEGASTSSVAVSFTNRLEPNEPNLEKQVTNFNDSSDMPVANFVTENPWNKSADYDIGDQVPYRITTFIPSEYFRAQSAYTYIIEDTMNHLEYVGNNGALVGNDGKYTGSGRMYAFVKSDTDGATGTWYDVSHLFSVGVGAYASGQQAITVYPTTGNDLKTVTSGYVVTNWGDADTHGDKAPFKEPTTGALRNDAAFNGDIRYLQFRYKATLKEDALIGPETGNRNTAKLKYTNGPSTTTYTESDTNVVYTYKLEVLKTDGTNNLTGAQFQLFKKYKQAPDNSAGRTVATGFTFHELDSSVTSLNFSSIATGTLPSIQGDYYLVTPSSQTVDPNFIWNGIDDGYYILIETKAPDGYIPLSRPLVFKIDTKLKTNVAGFDNGSVNVYPEEDKSYFTVSSLGNSAAAFKAKVPNRAGVELPSTGGPGTAAYLAAGIALMALALILAQIRRKRSLA